MYVYMYTYVIYIVHKYKYKRADLSGGAPTPFSKHSARFIAAALCPCVSGGGFEVQQTPAPGLLEASPSVPKQDPRQPFLSRGGPFYPDG